eukprot:4252206-Pyramimonas_sp.AAC.1
MASDWFPPQVYPPVPPPIGSCPRHILPSLLRLVPAPGIFSRPSSDWSPPAKGETSADRRVVYRGPL